VLTKKKQTPTGFATPKFNVLEHNEGFEFSERSLGILAAIWIAVAALIYYLLQSTLITLLDASRWYILFGLIGFSLAFLFREQFQLSLLDGLYINVFVTGPLCILLLLGLNRIDSATYTEQYKIESYEANGGKYVIELEDNAYEEFWRIRNVSYDTRPAQMHDIEFTFSDGLFGYKVLKETRLYRP